MNKFLFAFSVVIGLAASLAFCLLLRQTSKLDANTTEHKIVQKTQKQPLRARKHIYSLTYGKATAPHHMVNFFDMGCTHCQTFYRTIWPEIKERFVETGKLRFTFTPYPVHTETVLFMTCAEQLGDTQQQILFEVLMEQDAKPYLVIKICMTALRKTVPSPSSAALKEALLLTKRHQFEALPMILWEGHLLTDEQQDNILQFLQENIK